MSKAATALMAKMHPFRSEAPEREVILAFKLVQDEKDWTTWRLKLFADEELWASMLWEKNNPPTPKWIRKNKTRLIAAWQEMQS